MYHYVSKCDRIIRYFDKVVGLSMDVERLEVLLTEFVWIVLAGVCGRRPEGRSYWEFCNVLITPFICIIFVLYKYYYILLYYIYFLVNKCIYPIDVFFYMIISWTQYSLSPVTDLTQVRSCHCGGSSKQGVSARSLGIVTGLYIFRLHEEITIYLFLVL